MSTLKSQYSHGSEVEYACQRFYTLDGPTHKTCINGEWIGAMTCLSKSQLYSYCILCNDFFIMKVILVTGMLGRWVICHEAYPVKENLGPLHLPLKPGGGEMSFTLSADFLFI